ncbi:hypothetical protein GCM10023063_15130 [Arthrobacter methylotrophus]|uniref:Uncharacterized protein n=2 Tax=Arthrobacter methylotrophus TaxID=121291 RepID=A0ABV5UN40_9MICC
MVWGKTEEQKRAEAASRAQEEFAATPLGQATAAFENNDRFFQIELKLSELVRKAVPSRRGSEIRRSEPPADLLGKIELIGWKLEHAGYVFVETGSTINTMGTINNTTTKGEVIGVYLFRRAAD